MPFFDLPIAQLEVYRPDVPEPADFDEFWATTLADHPVDLAGVTLEPTAAHLTGLDCWDVTFAGFGGMPIRAWYLRPRGVTEDLPAVVEFIGYGGGRGLPEKHLAWPTAGYAHLVMDTRGQGGDTWDAGETGPTVRGVMTRGLTSPRTYYYRRLFTDAVNAVAVTRSLPGVDPHRVAVTGTSQGGGIAIAAAALSGTVVAALPNVPFLCDFQRAIGLTGATPYQEIADFLARQRDLEDEVMTTLSYFDGVNFAKRSWAPAFFSVGLMDIVTPPSTVYAAHNWWQGRTDMQVYRFNGHEGGEVLQQRRQIEWLGALLGG